MSPRFAFGMVPNRKALQIEKYRIFGKMIKIIHNSMIILIENSKNLKKERKPIAPHGLLLIIFLFSSIFLFACGKKTKTEEKIQPLFDEAVKTEENSLSSDATLEAEIQYWRQMKEILTSPHEPLPVLEDLLIYLDQEAWKIVKVTAQNIGSAENLEPNLLQKRQEARAAVYGLLENHAKDESLSAAIAAIQYRLQALFLSPVASFLSGVGFIRDLALNKSLNCALKERSFNESMQRRAASMQLGFKTWLSLEKNSQAAMWIEALVDQALNDFGRELNDCSWNDESYALLYRAFDDNYAKELEKDAIENEKIRLETLADLPDAPAYPNDFNLLHEQSLEILDKQNFSCEDKKQALNKIFEDGSRKIQILGQKISDDGLISTFISNSEEISILYTKLKNLDESCDARSLNTFLSLSRELFIAYSLRRWDGIAKSVSETNSCENINAALTALSKKRLGAVVDALNAIADLSKILGKTENDQALLEIKQMLQKPAEILKTCPENALLTPLKLSFERLFALP